MLFSIQSPMTLSFLHCCKSFLNNAIILRRLTLTRQHVRVGFLKPKLSMHEKSRKFTQCKFYASVLYKSNIFWQESSDVGPEVISDFRSHQNGFRTSSDRFLLRSGRHPINCRSHDDHDDARAITHETENPKFKTLTYVIRFAWAY